jgi:hypothetical protein
VGGSINVATGYKVGTVAGSNASCSAGNSLTGMTVKGGIVVDGSCNPSGAGDVIANSTQTFSGTNNFKGATNFISSITASSSIDTIGIGLGNVSGTQLNNVDYIWAKSIDGATQSTGCFVVVGVANGNNATSNSLTYTSTTTAITGNMLGVLMDNSVAPGSYARIAIRGLVRMKAIASSTVDDAIITSTTRCAGNSVGSFAFSSTGIFMATDTSTWATVFLTTGK